MGGRLFTGRDEVAASAELSSYVIGVARSNHVLIQSASTRPVLISKTGVRTLRVEIRAESDLRGILEFLGALDHGDRFVRIERLEVARPASVEEATERQALTLSLVVNGFAVGDPPPPTAGRGAAPPRRPGGQP
jgi:hypothetical protein